MCHVCILTLIMVNAGSWTLQMMMMMMMQRYCFRRRTFEWCSCTEGIPAVSAECSAKHREKKPRRARGDRSKVRRRGSGAVSWSSWTEKRRRSAYLSSPAMPAASSATRATSECFPRRPWVFLRSRSWKGDRPSSEPSPSPMRPKQAESCIKSTINYRGDAKRDVDAPAQNMLDWQRRCHCTSWEWYSWIEKQGQQVVR